MPFSVFVYLKQIYEKHVERAKERQEQSDQALKEKQNAKMMNPKKKIF